MTLLLLNLPDSLMQRLQALPDSHRIAVQALEAVVDKTLATPSTPPDPTTDQLAERQQIFKELQTGLGDQDSEEWIATIKSSRVNTSRTVILD